MVSSNLDCGHLTGAPSVSELAEREGLYSGQIYRWKTQLENRAKIERIEDLSSDPNISIQQARKIVELEEELVAYKEKVAEQSVVIDVLKKLHPSLASEKSSSGYIEIKRNLDRNQRRRK